MLGEREASRGRRAHNNVTPYTLERVFTGPVRIASESGWGGFPLLTMLTRWPTGWSCMRVLIMSKSM